MIQRIQSIYLLIVVALSVMILLMPVSSKIIPADATKNIMKNITFKSTVYGIEKYENGTLVSTDSNFMLMILNSATGILSLIIIFLYNKRMLQIKLSKLCVLLTSAFIAVDFYFSDSLGSQYGPDYKTMYMSGSYFPIIQIILFVMIIRAIKKDEELVKSADRIR
jgi:hypothetical protein